MSAKHSGTHSALPWLVCTSRSNRTEICNAVAPHPSFALMVGSKAQQFANAEYIVRCVNSHEHLERIAKDMLELFEFISAEAYHADGLEHYDMAIPTERVAELREIIKAARTVLGQTVDALSLARGGGE